MPAKDLVYYIRKWKTWGIYPYFCPECGTLQTGGYVTEHDDKQCWGSYLNKQTAIKCAEKILEDPICLSCVMDEIEKEPLK